MIQKVQKNYRYFTLTLYTAGAIAGISVCTALAFSFAVPAAAAVLPAFSKSGGGLSAGPVFHAFLFTVKQAAASMLIALAAGIPAAYFVSKKNFPGRRLLLSLSAVPLCIPPLLTALGYVLFFGMRGWLNTLLMRLLNTDEPPITFLFSFTGLVITHGFYNFPIVMKTCADAWGKLQPNQADAARLLGAGEWRVFRTVTIYQLAPSAVSSAMIVFLYCYFSFVIVLLFGGTGGTTLEVLVYQSARSTLDFSTAAKAAIAETAGAVFFAAAYMRFEQRSGKGGGAYNVPQIMQRSKKFTPFQLFTGLLLLLCILVFFILPLSSIIIRAFSEGFSSLTAVFKRKSFFYALLNSAAVGVCSSVLSVCAACTYVSIYTYASVFRHRSVLRKRIKHTFLDTTVRLLPLLPLAVSPIMLGIGASYIFQQANFLVLVLLQSALVWPFALRQIQGAADKIPRNMIDAGVLMSPNVLYAVFKILLPACSKQIYSSLAFCFSISCGDASLPVVLGIPNFETLSLMTYRLAGSYRFSQACVCGLMLAFLTVVPFAVSESISEKDVFRDSK